MAPLRRGLCSSSRRRPSLCSFWRVPLCSAGAGDLPQVPPAVPAQFPPGGRSGVNRLRRPGHTSPRGGPPAWTDLPLECFSVTFQKDSAQKLCLHPLPCANLEAEKRGYSWDGGSPIADLPAHQGVSPWGPPTEAEGGLCAQQTAERGSSGDSWAEEDTGGRSTTHTFANISPGPVLLLTRSCG